MLQFNKNTSTILNTVNHIDPRLNQIIDCLYRVSAKAVIIDEGKLLVVWEITDNWYSLPGGGIDHGTTAHETLERELAEELGIDSYNLQIEPDIIYAAHSEIVYDIPRVQLYYRVHLKDPTAVHAKELTFRWVTRDEFTDLSVSPATAYAQKFLLNLL